MNFAASAREVLCYFGESVDIGRSQECRIPLPRAPRAVSSKHASLYFASSDRTFYIKDEESKNGTFVNGERIPSSDSVLLRSKDFVELSNALAFRFYVYGASGEGVAPCGALVYYKSGTNFGKEIARYILVPGDRFSIGSLPDCPLPVENPAPPHRMGWLVREAQRLLFVEDPGERTTKLTHGSELSFGLSRVTVDLEVIHAVSSARDDPRRESR